MATYVPSQCNCVAAQHNIWQYTDVCTFLVLFDVLTCVNPALESNSRHQVKITSEWQMRMRICIKHMLIRLLCNQLQPHHIPEGFPRWVNCYGFWSRCRLLPPSLLDVSSMILRPPREKESS